MELIDWKIESAEKDLKRLKEKYKLSFESVKEDWESSYRDDLKDKCEMIYALAQGLIYIPYRFNDDLKFTRAQTWKTNTYLDFCHIYEGFGNPTGFISLKSGLFDATESYHKKMWINEISENGETCSFEDFIKKIKEDTAFLIQCFNKLVKNEGSGAFSTRPYLVEYENKKLKTEKFYIYLTRTTRRLNY